MTNVSKIPNEHERVILDLSCGEVALPGHLMVEMSGHVSRAGYQFRADIRERLDNGVMAALAPLPHIRALNVAKRVDGIAQAMIRTLDSDAPIESFVVSAQFALTLVDEGYMADKDNMAVLVSLLIFDELKEYGQFFGYRYDEAKVKSKSLALLTAAQVQGYYLKRLDQKPSLAAPQGLLT